MQTLAKVRMKPSIRDAGQTSQKPERKDHSELVSPGVQDNTKRGNYEATPI